MKVATKRILLYTGISLLAAATGAQAQLIPYPVIPRESDTNSSIMPPSRTGRDTTESRQFFKAKDLVGADVKDSSGDKVGDVTELYFNPENGSVLALIDVQGSKDAVVPLQALKVHPARSTTRNAEVTVKGSADLRSGPTLSSSDRSKLDDESFTRQVYSYYHVDQPSAMGGSSDLEGTRAPQEKKHADEHCEPMEHSHQGSSDAAQ